MERPESDRLDRQRRGDRRFFTWLFAFLAGVLVLGLMAIAYEAGFSHGKDEGRKVRPTTVQAQTQPSTTATQAAQPPATASKDLFASTCGGCHTLAAAGTTGTEGPNLDDLQPDQATVESAIQGGPGPMPAGLLTGAQAQQVAAFVAASAGR